jgi:hypothetical protein
MDYDHLILGAETVAGGSNIDWIPFSGVRGFAVDPGPHTFKLLCNKPYGDVKVMDSSLVALFVAQ